MTTTFRDGDVQRFLDRALRDTPDEVIELAATAGEWAALFREVLAARKERLRQRQPCDLEERDRTFSRVPPARGAARNPDVPPYYTDGDEGYIE